MSDDFDIHNIFSPAQEIMDPEKFAGRKNNISSAIKALCRSGTSILVYGERGVGKSSFVEMVKLIAQDQVELLYRYKLNRMKPTSGFQYKLICIECDEDVDTTEKVLHRLITSPEGIQGIIGPIIEKIETTTKDNLSVKLFKNMVSADFLNEEKITQQNIKEISIFELFTNLILTINQIVLKPNEGLLIVIDEFDRVKDNRKFASLIKTLSKNKTKFLISGIAESYTDLLQSHASVERQLYEGRIKINPMTDEEIDSFFEMTSTNCDNRIDFHKTFIEEVKVRSCGYPHYVQLFGQLALDDVVASSESGNGITLRKEHLIEGLKQFAIYEPKLEQRYISVVGGDCDRELLLKACSAQIASRIDQNNIFGYCRKRGMADPKKTLQTLLSFKDPEILKRIDSNGISFVDPIFKIFVGVRPYIFPSDCWGRP